jgi:RND family efflux transporter MFP subunit
MEDKIRKDLEKLRINHSKNHRFVLTRYPVLLLLLAPLILLIGLFLLSSLPVSTKQVSIITVTAGSSGETEPVMTAGGYVVAESEVTVSSKVAGRIASLPVAEGDLVHKGDIIAVLDGEELQVQQEEARANLENAYLNLKHKQKLYQRDVAELKRRRALFKEHLISPAELDKEEKTAVVAELELDQAQSEVDVREKQFDLARIRAADAIVRAPIAGTVVDKISDVGEMLFPMKTFEGISGSAVVTLADLTVMNVEVDINEDEIKKIHIGNPARITPDSFSEKTYEGEVMAISPMADRQKNVVPVKVRIKNPDACLKPDMSAKVSFTEKATAVPREEAGISIPRDAVIERDGKSIVFVVENGEACEREVLLGALQGAWVTIERGVKHGEKLVVEGHAHLRPHDQVSLQEKTALGL